MEGFYHRPMAWTWPCTHMGMRSHLCFSQEDNGAWWLPERLVQQAEQSHVPADSLPVDSPTDDDDSYTRWSPLGLCSWPATDTSSRWSRSESLMTSIILNFLDLPGQGSQFIISLWLSMHSVMGSLCAWWRIVQMMSVFQCFLKHGRKRFYKLTS